MCDNLGIPDNKKVIVYSVYDDQLGSNVILTNIDELMEYMKAYVETMEVSDDIEFTVKCLEMTEREIENLPEAC